MKRYLAAVAVLALLTGLLEARGNGGNSNGGGKNNSSATGKVASNSTSHDNGSKSSDSGKSHVVNGKVGDLGKSQADKGFKATKFDLQGNKNVSKLPGFKSDPQLHAQLLQKYHVPAHLHNFCFFHHDFCWNSCCWMPNFGCCCYWHPYCHCWYYWYAPYSCYLPYSYIEVYRPVVVTETAPVSVNVNNTNTNTNSNVEAEDPASLPPGATATLPAGVNPVVPAPKQ